MYGIKNKSIPQRVLILASECLYLIFIYWFLFLKGNEFFHLSSGNFNRKVLLFIFCLIVFVRMSFMIVYLLKRGITWSESVGNSIAFVLYYVVFPILGGINGKSIDWIDYIAILIFITGSLINTLSEILRNIWKRDERNKGKLYTGGLFRHAMHINYFGDLVWVSGFALLTRNDWAIIIPIFLFIMFLFSNIPNHDKYLKGKYGESFEVYEKKTKRFIPFIY